jgi:hypothetical protein
MWQEVFFYILNISFINLAATITSHSDRLYIYSLITVKLRIVKYSKKLDFILQLFVKKTLKYEKKYFCA